MEINKFIEAGKAEGWLHETDNINRLRLDGRDQDCRVYEVRIDKLHYNPQNGRIATFVSRYEMEHGNLPTDTTELDNLLEKLIEEDNPARLKTTRLDIKAKGQQEVAIILSNGTVIDGNRRFTCLRMLSREENETRFMRCYIFPDIYDAKAIKGLELEIQLGRDEKLNYDAISRLVDINTWVKGGKMTAEEYAQHANIKPAEMKKHLREIDVMNDFLEFIGEPGAYHIAQDMKLQGTIESLANKLTSCKNEDQREDMKSIVFANALTGNLGDRARAVRDLCDDIAASFQQEDGFAERQLDLTERVLDKFEALPEGAPVTTEFIRDTIGADADLVNEQKASREAARIKAGNRKIKNSQVRNVQDAVSSLQAIDEALLGKLEKEQLADMLGGVEEILRDASMLKVKINSLMGA